MENEKTVISVPFFSIIVPVYNVEQYLSECVNSILGQTFTKFECILVDDGSIDNCPTICDEYANKDQRIKAIHKKNGGLSDARNEGINVARGEYLIFIDSDDYLVSNECLADLECDIKSTRFNLYLLNNIVSEKTDYSKRKCSKVVNRNNFIKKIIKNSYKRLCACAYICKREFFISNNLYYFKGILHEDEEWLPRMVFSLKQNDKILIYNNYLYFHRMNRDGAITYTIKPKNISDRLLIIDRILSDINEDTDTFKREFLETRAAQILMYIFVNGKEIYLKDENIKRKIYEKVFLLKKSKRIKHNIYYLVIKIGLSK